MKKWHEKWRLACNQASFYHSGQNESDYWDQVAKEGSAGLNGEEHIQLLLKALKNRGILPGWEKRDKRKVTVLDVGCGQGDYTYPLALEGCLITALDYSEEMLSCCKNKMRDCLLRRVTFEKSDITTYETTDQYDVVLACLTPVTYQPEVFEKLLGLTKGVFVYFSMDTDLAAGGGEPIYRGSNSVRYPEEYLREEGISYEKIPYEYKAKTAEGKVVSIPFAYLIIEAKK